MTTVPVADAVAEEAEVIPLKFKLKVFISSEFPSLRVATVIVVEVEPAGMELLPEVAT